MKLKIEKVIISFNSIIASEVELEGKGTGSKEDPLIIDSTNKLPEIFRIRDSHLYINMYDCSVKQIMLINVKNISFRNCDIRGLIFVDSRENSVIGSKISRSFILRNSHHNSIELCNIKKLKLIKSNNNYFKKDLIGKVKDFEGKDNLFDENVFSEKLTIQELKSSSFISIIKSKLLLYIIYIILIIVIISIFYMIVPPAVTLIFLFVFISFLIFTMVIPDIYKWKKRKKK